MYFELPLSCAMASAHSPSSSSASYFGVDPSSSSSSSGGAMFTTESDCNRRDSVSRDSYGGGVALKTSTLFEVHRFSHFK